MKNYIEKGLLVSLGLLFTLAGCKEYVPLPPDFNVKAASQQVKGGEPLLFEIEGNPDFLLFYSGEAGKEYPVEGFGGAVTIKGMDTRVETFSFTYQEAGTYTATFVGASNSVYGKKEILRSLHIVVMP